MTEPKKRTFAEIAATQRASFISYREVLEKLAAETEESLAEIAAGLKAYAFGVLYTAYLDGIEGAVVRYADGDPSGPEILLETTIRRGVIVAASYDSRDPEADPDRVGWMREPFIAALSAADFPCPDSLSEPPPYRPRTSKPPARPLPTDDAELVKRLGEAEAEIETLRAELAGREPVDCTAADLGVQLEAARREIAWLREGTSPVEGYLRPQIVETGRRFWPENWQNERRPKVDYIMHWIRERWPTLSKQEAAVIERAAAPVDRDPSPPSEGDRKETASR
jgi:hypothetical protein